jgi:hypothetical protein
VAEAMGLTVLTDEQAKRVKMLLLMTASETNREAEVYPNPALNRSGNGGWDLCEGYGRLNVDAAVAAATNPCEIGSPWRATLAGGATGQRVWARKIRLKGGITQQFWMDNPASGDFDLYLYYQTPTVDGLPIMTGWSTSAGSGGSETFTIRPSATRDYYLVVKRVSGQGEFSVGVITRSDRLASGWHLISLPNQRVVPAPTAVFPGIPLHLRLYRWDPIVKGYVAYRDDAPEEFGDCDSHDGYWLYLEEPYTIEYVGMITQCEQHFPLPAEGWYLIGHPFTEANLIADFQVEDTVTGQRVSMEEAVRVLHWLGLPAYGWAADDLRYTSHGLQGPPMEDKNVLEPWHGYWLVTYRPALRLIMPPVTPPT